MSDIHVSLKDAISAHVHDGQSLAMEGFTHLIPFAAAHEIIRQGRKGLTLIRMTPDVIYDQMIGMGCAKRLVFSYAGNPGAGLLRRVRDAVENGWPNALETEEHSHAAMAQAYEAGAAGLPFAVFRGYRGAQLADVNPTIKSVTCPYTGEELATVPSVRPDVGIVHAQKADREGNVLIEGILGVQKECLLAAKAAIVTVEEIVDDLRHSSGATHANATIIPHWCLSAVCHVPGGANPSYASGYYPRDNATYLDWDPIAADRDAFLAWMDEHVMQTDPSVFADRVKGL